MSTDAPAEDYLDLSGSGRVHLFRAGAGEPVLFLHAAGGAGTWPEFHARLAAGFDVIAPDHPGFGKSDDFPEADDITDLVYHYLDVLDALGLESVHVAGGSFGGWIAAELAVHSPHRVRSLTLLSAAGLRLPEYPPADLFATPPEKIPALLFRNPPPAPSPDAEPDIDAVLAAYRDSTALARFCWKPFMANPKLERRLRRITAPALVVAPDDDRVIPAQHAKRYAERIPGARYAEVSDCGHAMYFEKPAEFADVVSTFLNEVNR
ncbi:MAG: alpha/beta fold hydrolase [Streptosporangiales bacterium]|nr:alpha/beta fold hydrolase [Streptosporangiales bacterium]